MSVSTFSYFANRNNNAIGLLNDAVQALTRQHRNRFYTRHGLDALFWGLTLATLAVLAIRLLQLPLPVLSVSTLLVSLAVLAGAALAWRKQPGKMAIAIAADEKLKLKQMLSTAWEFSEAQPNSDITRALAIQAVGRRHPTINESVFPFDLNLWGMLAPLAAALLILANIVDLQRIMPGNVVVADTQVVDEGARLKAFARRMQQQAEREGYPLSLLEAGNLEQLGIRMESGALARKQTLQRLQALEGSISKQHARALLGATGSQGDSPDARSLAALDGMRGLEVSNMLNRLMAGQLLPGDLEALGQAAEKLSGLGMPADKLREALDQYASGQAASLQRILATLSEADLANRDAEELDKARQRVARARENLGDADPTGEKGALIGQGPGSNEQGNAESQANYGSGETPGGGRSAGSGWDRELAPHEMMMAPEGKADSELSDQTGVTLRPQGRPGEGSATRSQTRALPKINATKANSITLDKSITSQMEAVLARDDYPLHRKELVRRYFLNLSTAGEEQ